jgi:ATP-dependent helicase/nuclease subunit A
VQLETGPCVTGTSAERNLALQVYAADRIAEWAAEAPGRSFGVLTRTNATVARLIYLLRARGVEVSQEGGNPLTDSAAVEVILSAIMLAEHPGDGRWWYHVQHSPLVRLPELQHASDAVTAGAAIRQQIEDWGLVAAIRKLADPAATVCDASDSLRLRQLLQLAQSYESNPQPRLSDFVRLVREKRVERPQPAQVRVMTVHQAKGLEFDAVVLPELDGNLTRQARKCIARCPDPSAPPEAMLRYLGGPYWHFLPEPWQRTFGLHAAGLMTEALCLLYVALTRPRSAYTSRFCLLPRQLAWLEAEFYKLDADALYPRAPFSQPIAAFGGDRL